MKMTCEQWSEEFRKWLDREWVNGNVPLCPSPLRRHGKHCSRCGPRLQAALLLVEGKSLSRQAPVGLPERIFARLGGGKPIRRKAWLPWVGIPAAALLLVALGFLLVLRAPGHSAGETVIVRFELQAPDAREVSVVGNWNQWNPEVQKLKDPDGDGVWVIEIPLNRREENQYQFLIDGEEWIPDPEAPLQIEDGFGGVNSILQI
jgi:hypothetical protein